MADLLIVSSKVREYLKSKGVKMSGELPGAVDAKVKAMLDDAAKRCQGNKRSTVKPQDV